MRCELLEDAIDALGFSDRVTVLSGRAEEAGRDPKWRGRFDVAVARGFAAPAVTAECAAPLLRVGGLLCVSEPPSSDPFSRWPEAGCAELGMAVERSISSPNSYVLLRQVEPCAGRFPRRVGVPSKRPLF